MKDLFLNYKESLLMKEKGFDEPCFGRWWHDEFKLVNIDKQFEKPDFICLAPLYQQAIQWIIKKIEPKNPFVNITLYADGSGCWVYGSSDTQIIFQNLSDSISEGLKLID